MTEHIELDRRFWPADIDEENSTESMRTMAALGIDQQIFWDDLLKKTFVELIKILKEESVVLTNRYPRIAALEIVGIDFTLRKFHKTMLEGSVN